MKTIVSFKSTPEFFEDERNGTKPNTVRILDSLDPRIQKRDVIVIINTDTGESFHRELAYVGIIGNICGRRQVIYCWRHEDA